jgi:hypothetical protein
MEAFAKASGKGEGGVNGPELVETSIRYGKGGRKERAMIARFDHHPVLTALLALTTAVLVVVVITLSTLLITSAPASSPSSVSDGGYPGAAAVPGDRWDAGGKSYGSPVKEPAQTGNGADSAVDHHAKPSSLRYNYYNNHYR